MLSVHLSAAETRGMTHFLMSSDMTRLGSYDAETASSTVEEYFFFAFVSEILS